MRSWLRDVRDALLTWPDRAAWRRAVSIWLLFVVAAVPVAWRSGLVAPELAPVTPRLALAIVGTILLHPAFGEEFLFRVLMLPRRPDSVSPVAFVVRGLASLVLYVGAHPLNAWLTRPAVLPVFTNPWYLALATLLGVACSAIYVRTGSVWPSVLVHWTTVSAWILLLGGQSRLRI